MTVEELRARVRGLSDEQIRDMVAGLPTGAQLLLLNETGNQQVTIPPGPAEQAVELDPDFVTRPHLSYLSERLTQAVRDVEAGTSRRLLVNLPPRTGKSTLCTQYAPLWMLRQHPDWPIALVSHEDRLTTLWGRQVRRWIEQHPHLGLTVAPDAGAASEWQTTEDGGVVARSLRGSITGRGAKVMVIDDPIKDFVEAHSENTRQAVWDWWLSTGQTRLEAPYLVLVVMTRWHQDDFAGRLTSTEHEGNPGDWEVIRFPALAESPPEDQDTDSIGRVEGEPLLSPLTDEVPDWHQVRADIGTYSFSAMYQQSPSPAKGIIFDPSWWRYWTTDPSKATEDGRVVYLDPHELAADKKARWLDSWDMAFKGTDGSDYVVGQRWAKKGANRYLIHQSRARRTFTQTLALMHEWADLDRGPVGTAVTHEHLVEDKANGTAVIDTLKDQIAGLIPVNPTDSKEARARSVTPEVESGNVYLPHPTDPGMEWVTDFLDEARNFPRSTHDDQIDGGTQALRRFREERRGHVSNPASGRINPGAALARRRISQVAQTQRGRRYA